MVSQSIGNSFNVSETMVSSEPLDVSVYAFPLTRVISSSLPSFCLSPVSLKALILLSCAPLEHRGSGAMFGKLFFKWSLSSVNPPFTHSCSSAGFLLTFPLGSMSNRVLCSVLAFPCFFPQRSTGSMHLVAALSM